MRRMNPLCVAVTIATGCLGLAFAAGADEPGASPPPQNGGAAQAPAANGDAKPAPVNPLNADRAYGYLKQICDIGPRKSGTPEMKKQQALLESHFKKLGGKVTYQRFAVSSPEKGADVPMANMVVEWHPERKERILLCAHYDTRPQPDRDPDPTKRRTGTFIGANDGGSGTALLMELAHLMPKLDGPLGVDFLLVDGEELVYVEGRDRYCLGSAQFAQKYAASPPGYSYRWGIVLDMVGDADLTVYQEQLSNSWADTRPMVRDIWATAGRLGVKEFIPRVGYEVSDDHVPLRAIGRIPTCDIIDFVYPHWHTTGDRPERCSGSSLAKVGWVVYEWIKMQEAAKPPAAVAPATP